MIEACQAVLDGEIERLMIAAPPRTWKSRTTVQGTGSARMRNQPRSKLMVACASIELVGYHSRHTRQHVVTSCGDRFLRTDSKSVALWETQQGGAYKATTILGGQLGFGWDLLITDDPFASRDAAQSRLIQRRTWERWRDDLQTRAQDRPEGGPPCQILMHQRLAEGDVLGRLLDWLEETGGQEWHALILDGFRDPRPYALPECVERIEDRREPGEPLCDDEGVMREIADRRENNPRLHAAVDQQRPPADIGAGVFRKSWLPIIGRDRTDLAKPYMALAAMAAAGEITMMKRQMRGHDYAGGGEDAVGSCGVCQLEPGGRYEWILYDPTTDHPVAAAVETVAIGNSRRDPMTTEQAIPKETGVGAALAASIRKQLQEIGYRCHPMKVSPGKVALAQPLATKAAPTCELCALIVVDPEDRKQMPKGSVCECDRPKVRLGKVAILATPDERAERLRDRMHDFDGEGEDDDVDAACCGFNALDQPQKSKATGKKRAPFWG